MARLDGKIALITGGAGGIGAAAARRFVAEGATVVLVDRDAPALSEIAAQLGDSASFLVGDVAEEGDNRRFAEETLRRHGRIDIALLNAGIEGEFGTIADLPVAVFDRVMAVNVRGVWLGLAAIMPVMRGQGGGSIVITSSIGGLRGSAGWAAYAASKHAEIGLMKSAALEGAAHKIRVNTVNPAPIATRMIRSIDAQTANPDRPDPAKTRAGRIPLGRYGDPEDVAAMMVFLASDESRFCTGGSYLVDGGAMTG